MEINRRAFIGSLGGAAAVQAMSPNARAEALEHYMIEQLDGSEGINEEEDNVSLPFYDPERPVPRGTGRLFAENKNLKPMPGLKRAVPRRLQRLVRRHAGIPAE